MSMKETKIVICRQCGREMDMDDNFCSNCGEENYEVKRSRKLYGFCAGAAILAAVLVGGMVYYNTKAGSKVYRKIKRAL